jgi:carboxyl-terminal processing protease
MSPFARIITLLVVLASTLAVGFGWRDLSQGRMPRLERLSTAIAGRQPHTETLAPTQTFVEVLGRVNGFYYGETDKTRLLYAGIAGMLSALKDPHTVLLEPDIARQFQEKSHGEFVGIGAELGPDVLGARVRRVFKDSPAKEAGLKPSDIITKVEAKDIAGMDLPDVVKLIRGEEGSFVRLNVYRQESKENKLFRVSRRRVQIQDVYGELLNGSPKIGRLEVRSFSETIVTQFDRELQELESQGMRGLIIDLRGNPGGLLSAAVEMCSRFLDGRVITSMRKRDGKDEVFVARSGLADGRQYPVVILVDENSASAAEIFAGAMHDWRAATLVGEHTFGKGSVQIVRPLPDGAQLKMTIARYYLPSGESVQRIEDDDGHYKSGGIKPDVEVKLSSSQVTIGDPKTDSQLAKAVEVLSGKLK